MPAPKNDSLTQEELRQVLNYDAASGMFTARMCTPNRPVGALAGGVNKSTGYYKVSVYGRQYFAHRLAWLYVHGEWPEADIDHINRDKLDNRISNLREVDRSTNLQNRDLPPKKSGFVGVTKNKHYDRWAATITTEGRKRHLGMYSSPEDAHAAYTAARKTMHKGYVEPGVHG